MNNEELMILASELYHANCLDDEAYELVSDSLDCEDEEMIAAAERFLTSAAKRLYR